MSIVKDIKNKINHIVFCMDDESDVDMLMEEFEVPKCLRDNVRQVCIRKYKKVLKTF